MFQDLEINKLSSIFLVISQAVLIVHLQSRAMGVDLVELSQCEAKV